jgi:hypothetical protein
VRSADRYRAVSECRGRPRARDEQPRAFPAHFAATVWSRKTTVTLRAPRTGSAVISLRLIDQAIACARAKTLLITRMRTCLHRAALGGGRPVWQGSYRSGF